MTDTTQHPEALAFCWATELAMTQQPVTLSVTEAREVSAGMQRLHIENAAIQAGYAAARLKIKSLQARIKAMAEEHADELMVAHMDGRMRAAQPAGAQQPGAVYAVYAELPDERAAFEARFPVPGGVSWNGSEYVVKDDYLNSYRCDRFVGQWAAWQARASQPAPATQQAGEVVAYLDIGAGGYLDLGSALSDEDLQQLPKGRHALVIAGTYGIDGYVAAPQPSPTTKPAPQQEAQGPCPTCVALARTVMLDQVSFDRKPDCYGIRQITDDESVEEWEDIRTSPDVAREEANDMMATGRGEIYEVVPLWTTPQLAPQPAPDCHHRPPCDECAAIAAQKGK